MTHLRPDVSLVGAGDVAKTDYPPSKLIISKMGAR